MSKLKYESQIIYEIIEDPNKNLESLHYRMNLPIRAKTNPYILHDLLRVHSRNLPPSSQLTLNIAGCFDSYADFKLKYGSSYMIALVRFKQEAKSLASATCLPDIFIN